MNLEEQIQKDLKEAMKAKNTLKVEALREINSNFQLAKTEKNAKDFDNQRAIDCISKVAKTYLEIAVTAKDAGRTEAHNAAVEQYNAVRSYLPEEITIEALISTVELYIKANPDQKMGEVIKGVKQTVSDFGRTVDGKLLAAEVKKHF